MGGFPSRSQSTGDQLLKAKEKKKKKEPKYPKGSIWARSFDLAHSWCSDFRISSVFRIARVCSWWGGGTRRGGRQTTKTRREVSPRHVLSWRLQIASLWANHNSNNDAGRRTWGHRLPETILSFARGSRVNVHSGLIGRELLFSDVTAQGCEAQRWQATRSRSRGSEVTWPRTQPFRGSRFCAAIHFLPDCTLLDREQLPRLSQLLGVGSCWPGV